MHNILQAVTSLFECAHVDNVLFLARADVCLDCGAVRNAKHEHATWTAPRLWASLRPAAEAEVLHVNETLASTESALALLAYALTGVLSSDAPSGSFRAAPPTGTHHIPRPDKPR